MTIMAIPFINMKSSLGTEEWSYDDDDASKHDQII